MSQKNQVNTNNNSSTENQKPVEWAGFLNEFLWICAGVNRKILRQCPTDYAKYAGTGGTILFTAIMAALSGGYAISFVFQDAPLYVPVAFGIIWGLMIFNLDRFMVNTMYSDGKHTISKAEFGGGLPRIILAIFLGIVISTPLEIRIFQDKIKSQLIINQGKVGNKVRKAHEQIFNERKEINNKIGDLENQKNNLLSGKIDGSYERISAKEKELQDAEKRMYEETYGNGVTKQRGYGPAARQLNDIVIRLRRELSDLRLEEKKNNINNQAYIKKETTTIDQDIKLQKEKLNGIEQKISEIEKEGREGQKALTGFCAQIDALNEITSYKNTALFLARLFITLLFVSIEVIPTLFKMMVAAGPYDDILHAEKYRIKVLSDQKIQEANDFVQYELTLSTEKNKARLEAEMKANEDILQKLANAQSELIEVAIEEWKKQELEKVQTNPSAYINSTTNNT